MDREIPVRLRGSMKSVVIKVTEKDIQLGAPDSPEQCPIARAVRCACPQFQFVYVGEDFLGVRQTPGDLQTCQQIDLPEIARRFIRDFDERKPVQPISFELSLP
jgi:hypothetical protein